MKWIKATDRLPTGNENVFVRNKNNAKMVLHPTSFKEYNERDKLEWLDESEDECRCIRFKDGNKWYSNGCKIHPESS